VTNCPDPSEYPGGVIPGLFLQWFFEGSVIPGATNESLVISNVQPADLGAYWVEATAKYESDGINRTVRSDTADLQINSTGTGGFVAVQAKDKFLDTLLSPPWVIGGLVPTGAAAAGSTEVRAASGLTSGYTGTQVFNTSGSSSSSGETILCSGVPGGSSKWITLVSEVAGELVVNTAGSSYDTIIAIYGVDATSLSEFKACTIDGNNTNTPLRVSVDQDETFTILVDGQYGAFGTLVLNYSLIAPATLVPSEADSGNFMVRVIGYPGMKFDIEGSTNFVDWTPLISTNSEVEVFDYLDPVSPAPQLKYYRARFSP
jgi:hypothetical protein